MAAPVSTLAAAASQEEQLRAELAQTRAALNREIAARRRLERAVVEAAESEQHRLAQTLHDTLCQSMSGVHLMARVVARKLQGICPEGAREVTELGGIIQRAVTELHDIAAWLRLTGSDAPALVPALDALARLSSQKLPCEFHCPEPVVVSDRYAAVQLLQIAHQAVSDALQQGDTRRIDISLSSKDCRLTLTVRCDGCEAAGRARDGELKGHELLRHRASVLGATLVVSSQRGRGTTITCQLPQAR